MVDAFSRRCEDEITVLSSSERAWVWRDRLSEEGTGTVPLRLLYSIFSIFWLLGAGRILGRGNGVPDRRAAGVTYCGVGGAGSYVGVLDPRGLGVVARLGLIFVGVIDRVWTGDADRGRG